MKIIAIEEHWNSVSIRDALDRLQGGARDESVAFNTMGDNQARLEDIGQGRIEAMDAAGIDVSILSVVTPATQALPAREAVALARDANDQATDAVRAHPARFRAFATLPTSDPQAAAAELERCATQLGHVGAMVHGRTGTRPLDDPAYDDLFATAARWHQPIFIHPQIPSNGLLLPRSAHVTAGATSGNIADQRRAAPNGSRSVLVPAWRRVATAACGPHHRSPPVST